MWLLKRWSARTFIFSSFDREKKLFPALIAPSINSCGIPWFLTTVRRPINSKCLSIHAGSKLTIKNPTWTATTSHHEFEYQCLLFLYNSSNKNVTHINASIPNQIGQLSPHTGISTCRVLEISDPICSHP